MRNKKVIDALYHAVDAVEKLEKITKIINTALADINLDENAENYIWKIREVITWTQI